MAFINENESVLFNYLFGNVTIVTPSSGFSKPGQKLTFSFTTFKFQIVGFTPQVIHASHILVHLSTNSSIREHYDMMQTQHQFMTEHLQKLVDENCDSELFIRACEHSIVSETYQTQAAVQDQDSVSIVTHALNIVRRCCNVSK